MTNRPDNPSVRRQVVYVSVLLRNSAVAIGFVICNHGSTGIGTHNTDHHPPRKGAQAPNGIRHAAGAPKALKSTLGGGGTPCIQVGRYFRVRPASRRRAWFQRFPPRTRETGPYVSFTTACLHSSTSYPYLAARGPRRRRRHLSTMTATSQRRGAQAAIGPRTDMTRADDSPTAGRQASFGSSRGALEGMKRPVSMDAGGCSGGAPSSAGRD
ncbi:hypothetical protein LX36DRAFT_650787, partial [Colletotrichum falcatum]